MKRVLALCLMLALLLSGCARKQPEKEETQAPGTQQTESEKLAADAHVR